MNNKRRQSKDLNTLSAYLDNALSTNEVEELESRMKQEPELREELKNLRVTKKLISRLDRVSAPRNYTLKPDVVKVYHKKKQSLIVTLRLATSFAAMFLVVVFGVQLLLQGPLALKGLQSEAPMIETAFVADENTPEPLIFWGQPGVDSGDAEGYGGGTEGSMQEDFILEEPLPEIESPKEPTEMEMPSEEQREGFPEENLALQEYQEEEGELLSENLEELSPILGINPEQSGDILHRSPPVVDDHDLQPPWPKVIRWVEVGLAVLVLIGAILLLIFRNKRFYKA